jgi:hypothetical protein
VSPIIGQLSSFHKNAPSTLMMEVEEISEMMVFNSTLTWLITQEDFNM